MRLVIPVLYRWSLLLQLFIRAAIFVGSVQLVAAQVDAAGSKHLVVPSTFIVTLDPDSLSKRDLSSPWAGFYHDLRSRGVHWNTTREYHDPVLTGVAIQLNNTADLAKINEVAGVEFIRAVHQYPVSHVGTNDRAKISKRANGNGAPWSHTMTGVDKLHAAGYHGQGVTVGIVDSGIDYTHPALGAGFGPGHKVIGGYDFVGNAYTGRPDSPPPYESANPLDTCNGHGTQMAGVIGADPGHERGIAGVAYRASINAYRISSCSGDPREDDILAGVLRAHRDGNDVITLASSYFGGWSRTTLSVVLDRIAASGRVVVVAAGDTGQYGSWMGLHHGYHSGVIPVGSVFRYPLYPRDQGKYAAVTSLMSARGPSSNMYLTTALVAPGEEVGTTVPVRSWGYKACTGTHIAAAFVTGSVALWLQVKGIAPENAWAARTVFQSTAAHLFDSTRTRRMIETVSHQGAGLIQAHAAILGTASMEPAELWLNDTSDADLSWTIAISNQGTTFLTYNLTHVPAGTALTMRDDRAILGPAPLIDSPAEVRLSTSQVDLPAGSTQQVRVRFRPPIELDPATFPVYSGYIKAEGSDGSSLQSLYLGLAATLKDMPVLDDMVTHMGIPLPCVQDGRGVPIKESTRYTMRGNDRPTLVFRLVGYSPLLYLDLVDATTPGLWSRVKSKVAKVFKGKRPAKKPKVIGSIFRRSHVPRHTQVLGGGRHWEIERFVVNRFADGREIPEGDYKLMLRALKNYGDPRVDEDYEVWVSPVIKVRRGY